MYGAIVTFLNAVFSIVYEILTTDIAVFSPEAYSIASLVVTALQGVGIAISLICFGAGIVTSTGSYMDAKNPIFIFKSVLKLLIVQGLVVSSFNGIAVPLFSLGQGAIKIVFQAAGVTDSLNPFSQFVDGSGASWPGIIPGIDILSIVFLLACIVSGITIILVVAGRILKVLVYISVAPLPLGFFAGDSHISSFGRNYVKNLIGVVMEGFVMALAIVIFSAIVGNGAIVSRIGEIFSILEDTAETATITFFLVGLVAMIKGADTLSHKLFGFM